MHPTRLLRLPQVIDRTGIKKTKLYELQKDGLFPMRIKIIAHAVGWVEEEVDSWIAGRVAATRALPCQ
jgi:prophage regulatory protein